MLDTSVLMSTDRHWLWGAAWDGYYRGYWSAFIVGELVRVRMRAFVERGIPYREYRTHLNQLVDSWSDVLAIVNYRWTAPDTTLRDPDDRPVLATARAAGVPAVVSLNTRDFPAGGWADGVRFLTPAQFWAEIARLYTEADQAALLARHRAP
ncbi:MAG: PIN domain-containing protein [Chloroflexi bacterium]|nr:PIN domain-containing protein [Chloroflexota bacterium]